MIDGGFMRPYMTDLVAASSHQGRMAVATITATRIIPTTIPAWRAWSETGTRTGAADGLSLWSGESSVTEELLFAVGTVGVGRGLDVPIIAPRRGLALCEIDTLRVIVVTRPFKTWASVELFPSVRGNKIAGVVAIVGVPGIPGDDDVTGIEAPSGEDNDDWTCMTIEKDMETPEEFDHQKLPRGTGRNCKFQGNVRTSQRRKKFNLQTILVSRTIWRLPPQVSPIRGHFHCRCCYSHWERRYWGEGVERAQLSDGKAEEAIE